MGAIRAALRMAVARSPPPLSPLASPAGFLSARLRSCVALGPLRLGGRSATVPAGTATAAGLGHGFPYRGHEPFLLFLVILVAFHCRISFLFSLGLEHCQ